MIKLLVIFVFLMGCSSTELRVYQLSTQTPSDEPAQAIGSYSSGCLRGGEAIEISSSSFELLHPSRGRFWAHPKVIKEIEKISKAYLQESSRKMLIGDLGHARGGPSLTGHSSHQNGLDADIWFRTLKKNKTLAMKEREILKTKSFLNQNLDKDVSSLLRLASSNVQVQRIFVHPRIKKYLCENQKRLKFNDDNLSKIRPWWGHYEHFHLRFKCFESDKTCLAQKPPEGPSCDETLDWWFSEEAQHSGPTKKLSPPRNYKKRFSKLPTECQLLLRE